MPRASGRGPAAAAGSLRRRGCAGGRDPSCPGRSRPPHRQPPHHMDAYITGTADQGLFLMELRPAKNVSMEEMESTLWAELGQFQKEEILPSILQKLKNKNESTICFSNVSAANKATNIAYYESLGDAHLINTEADRIAEITAADIHRVVNMLRQDNVNIMRLLRSGKEDESIAMNQFEEEEEDE
jgi:hypothetical protein